MARRGWAAMALLCVAALVAVALAQAQVGAPTDLTSSKCYSCHKPGGTVAGTPLTVMYSLHPPGALQLAAGKPAPLQLEVRNEWLATLHNIQGTLDLSRAPSLSFQPPPAPLLGVKTSGTLAFDAATANTERSQPVKILVPAGATDVKVTLSPAKSTGIDAPDLALRLWPEGIPTDPDRAVQVDAAGSGASEVYHGNADALRALGYGNWTAAAVEAGFSTKRDLGRLETQDFTVSVDAWFNLTGERTQVAGSAARIDGKSGGPQSTTLLWNLFVEGTPKDGESLLFTVTAVASYTHPPQFNAVDDWAFTQNLKVPIAAPPAASGAPAPPVTTITLNTTSRPVTGTSADAFVLTEAGVSEAVGYFTTFAMVLSLVTGGLFGAASRRLLNTWFGTARRRINFHNVLSYLILVAAAAHTGLFLHEAEFPWTLGLLWGGLAILFLASLGVTGAWQVHTVRKWNYTTWRVLHYGAAVAATLFTLLHIGLDGVHFVGVQQSLGWRDPVGGWFGIR